MNMNSMIGFAIGNMMSEKMGIPSAYAGILGMVVVNSLETYSDDIKLWIHDPYVISGVVFSFVVYVLFPYVNNYFSQGYSFHEFRGCHNLDNLYNHMTTFKKNYDIAFNTINSENGVRHFLPFKNQKISFYDPKHNVKGYVTIYEEKKNVYNEAGKIVDEKIIIYGRLYLYKNAYNITARKYFKLMYKDYSEQVQERANFTLLYYKTFKEDDLTTIVYTGPKNPRAEMFNTFFHPKKEELIVYLDAVCDLQNPLAFTGQSLSFNAILYGPPGTGKSTFAYRIAAVYGRFIRSIDCRNYATRLDLYRAFNKGSPSGTIILLEEFDMVIDELLENENKIKNLTRLLEDEECKRTNIVEELEKLKSQVVLKDLLELVQGPCPVHGQIIIATTNHFDRIKSSCPALFRCGRFTPIEFGYLKRDEVNKLIKLYFKDDAPTIDFDPEIATSEIIEKANYAYLKQDPSLLLNHLKASRK